MNIIPLGYQCFSATSLRVLSLREVSLPFDWLVSPLPSTVEVLKILKDPNFNMQELLKKMFSIKSLENSRNILNINIAHFTLTSYVRSQYRRRSQSPWAQDAFEGINSSFDLEITEEQRLKCESIYRLNDEYCMVSHPKVYEIFERRFNRLKDMFFTQENILVYNDITVPAKKVSRWESSIKELMSLNPLNRLIYITYPDIQLQRPLVDRVEVYRVKKPRSEYTDNELPAHREIPSILSSVFADMG